MHDSNTGVAQGTNSMQPSNTASSRQTSSTRAQFLIAVPIYPTAHCQSAIILEVAFSDPEPLPELMLEPFGETFSDLEALLETLM
jgi:hypothetical protein